MKYLGYTNDTSVATYPVIESVNDQGFIIAYTIKKQNKDHVYYQRINIKE